MKKGQTGIHNILNILAIIDDTKCFQTVRELRRPDGVRCAHCDSDTVVKYGRDETPCFDSFLLNNLESIKSHY